MTSKLLLLVPMLAVLLFGAVEVWSSMIVNLFVAGLGAVWLFRGGYRNLSEDQASRRLAIIGIAFLAYIAFQTLPLPSFLAKALSPGAVSLIDYYSLGEPASYHLSLSPSLTWLAILKPAAAFFVFVLSAEVYSDRRRLTGAFTALAIFGFLLAVFAIVQKATWNGQIYWFRELTLGGEPFGPFVNRNHFAGLIGMLVPLCLGMALVQERREKRILFGFLAVIMSVSLFFSLSRGGIVSFFAGISLFGLLALRSKIKQRRALAVGIFVIAVAAYLLFLGIDPIVDRFYHTDVSREERLVVWSATLEGVRDFWLTGAGLGTYVSLFPLYSPPSVRAIYDHAHNDYLEFLLETGLIGVVLAGLFMVTIVRSVAKRGFGGRNSFLLMGAVSSAFTMLVHSIFDFNLHIPSNLLVFASVLGMIVSLSSRGEASDAQENASKSPRKKVRPAGHARGMVRKVSMVAMFLAASWVLGQSVRAAASEALFADGALARLVITSGDERYSRPEVRAEFTVEIAASPRSMARGLSGRIRLEPDRGMLFPLEGLKHLGFWMQEMHFPLDILFFDKGRRLIEILYDLRPCAHCEVFPAPPSADYALEIPAGSASRHGIRIGDTFFLRKAEVAR